MLMRDAVAVFLRRELRRGPFPRVHPQAGSGDLLVVDHLDRDALPDLDRFRVAAGVVGDFDDLVGQAVGLQLARACVLVPKLGLVHREPIGGSS